MNCHKLSLTLAVCIVSLFATGCTPNSNSNGTASSNSGGKVKLLGSGASFPAPLYDLWFKTYSAATPGVRIDYQAKGSGGGIKDFIGKTVDFAASDAAMDDDEISRVEAGVVMLPMTAGSVVLAYNLPKIDKPIKLSRNVYSKIFLGQLAKWNDPLLAADNPGVALPDLPITVVTRADSSGTTFVFTNHVSSISEDFKSGPGIGKSVNWPSSDKFVASPKNNGVAATIRQTPGAIGYVEFGFAQQAGLPMAELQNQAGKFIAPTLKNAEVALGAVEMPEDMRAWLPDPAGEMSYPIVSYTWLLCYKKYDDAGKAVALKAMVEWCLTDGQTYSEKLGYVPLPESVVASVRAKLATIE